MNDTGTLLDDIAAYFRRFVVCSDDHYTALALWAAHTYVYDAFDATPYLIITSAEKRSGKTRVFECLLPIVREPLLVASLTEAVLFRAVHQWKPSLLIDETDTIFKAKRGELSERQEMIRAVLNAGYRRSGYAIRCAPNGEPEKFSCYCPKALAGIGHLPDTVRDRGLSIRLHRRMRDEPIERFRHRTGETDGGAIARRLEGWGSYARLMLIGATPAMPEDLDDRAQDSYECLIAVADLGGEEWGARGREALIRLRRTEEELEESLYTLLSDVGIIADRLAGMERIATADLVALLYEEGEAPWSEWWGEANSKKAGRRLALALKEYGCEPEQFKENGVKKRGYKVGPILEAMARYGGSNTVLTVPTPDLQGKEGTVLGFEGSNGYRVESADLQGSTESTVLGAESRGESPKTGISDMSQSLGWGTDEGYETGS